MSPLIHNILLPDVRLLMLKRGSDFLFEKQLFEIIEVEITRVDCSLRFPNLMFEDHSVIVFYSL